MPTYNVEAPEDDYDESATGNTTIVAYNNQVIMTSQDAFALIDTSGIGTDEITSAVFHWYNHSYTKNKDDFFEMNISMSNDTGTSFILLYDAGYSNGWDSETVEQSEFISINKTGYTQFRFFITDRPAGWTSVWTIRAYEYTPTQTYSAYLVVEHGPPGGPTKTSVIFIT